MNVETVAALKVGAIVCHVSATPGRRTASSPECESDASASSQASLTEPEQSSWSSSGITKATGCLSPQGQTWITH